MSESSIQGGGALPDFEPFGIKGEIHSNGDDHHLSFHGADDIAAMKIGCRILKEGHEAKCSWWRRLFGIDEVQVTIKHSKGQERVAVRVSVLSNHLLLESKNIRKTFNCGEGKVEGLLQHQVDNFEEIKSWEEIRQGFTGVLEKVYKCAKKQLSGVDGIASFGAHEGTIVFKKLGSRVTFGRVDGILGEGSYGKVGRVAYSGLSQSSEALKQIKVSEKTSEKRLEKMIRDTNHEKGKVDYLATVQEEEGHFEPGLPRPFHSVTHFTVKGGIITESKVPNLLMHLHSGDSSRVAGRISFSGITRLMSALNFMHKHGMVHRDLKPQNIFYDIDPSNDLQGELVFGDYGFATILSEISEMIDAAKAGQLSNDEIRAKLSKGTPGFFRGEAQVQAKYSSGSVFLKGSDLDYMMEAVKEGNPTKVFELLCKSDVHALGYSFIELISGSSLFVENLEYLACHEELSPDSLKEFVYAVMDEKISVGKALKNMKIKNRELREVLSYMVRDIRRKRGITSNKVCQIIDGLSSGKSIAEVQLSMLKDSDFEKLKIPLEFRQVLERMLTGNLDQRYTMEEAMTAIEGSVT